MSDLRFAGWFSGSNLYVRVQIKFNLGLNGEPVQVNKILLDGWAPIIESKPGSKILDTLELIDIETWHVKNNEFLTAQLFFR